MRTSSKGFGKIGLSAAVTAALMLAVAPASAGPSKAPASHSVNAGSGTSDMTDFSARRRGHNNGGAAAAAAFAGIVGTAIAVGAANSAYNDGYGYGGGYGGGYGYGGSPYDANAYYGGPAYGGGYYSPRAYSRYGNSPNSVSGPGGYNNPSRW